MSTTTDRVRSVLTEAIMDFQRMKLNMLVSISESHRPDTDFTVSAEGARAKQLDKDIRSLEAIMLGLNGMMVGVGSNNVASFSIVDMSQHEISDATRRQLLARHYITIT